MTNPVSLFRALRVVTTIATTGLLMSAAAAAEASWSVEQLMRELSEVKHAKLEFTETKQSIFVITDITTEGNMEYRAPDYIEKNTLTPFKERVVISGDSMEIKKEIDTGKMKELEQTQTYSVQSHPLLKAAIESIRALLAGNFTLLEENYIMILEGDRGSWNMSLAPKSEEILEHIQEIRLTGEGFEIREVVTIQADGEESKLELSYLLLE